MPRLSVVRLMIEAPFDLVFGTESPIVRGAVLAGRQAAGAAPLRCAPYVPLGDAGA